MLRAFHAMMAFGFAGLLALSVPAQAQSSNDEPGFEQGLIRGLLGAIGVIGDDKPQIDYRERAPLVVPGNRTALPVPQDGSAVASNPSWPRDPDQERARVKARNDAQGRGLESGVLSRSQLASGAAPGAGRITEPRVNRQEQLGNYNSTQVEQTTFNGKLGKFLGGGGNDDKQIVFTGEPERRSLVEPPRGFRTPSPNAPYGPVGARVDDKTVIEQRKDASGR